MSKIVDIIPRSITKKEVVTDANTFVKFSNENKPKEGDTLSFGDDFKFKDIAEDALNNPPNAEDIQALEKLQAQYAKDVQRLEKELTTAPKKKELKRQLKETKDGIKKYAREKLKQKLLPLISEGGIYRLYDYEEAKTK